MSYSIALGYDLNVPVGMEAGLLRTEMAPHAICRLLQQTQPLRAASRLHVQLLAARHRALLLSLGLYGLQAEPWWYEQSTGQKL